MFLTIYPYKRWKEMTQKSKRTYRQPQIIIGAEIENLPTLALDTDIDSLLRRDDSLSLPRASCPYTLQLTAKDLSTCSLGMAKAYPRGTTPNAICSWNKEPFPCFRNLAYVNERRERERFTCTCLQSVEMIHRQVWTYLHRTVASRGAAFVLTQSLWGCALPPMKLLCHSIK